MNIQINLTWINMRIFLILIYIFFILPLSFIFKIAPKNNVKDESSFWLKKNKYKNFHGE